MNPIISDDLLAKLNKLKNLSEGAAAVGSLAEAENAAMKLQELLLKHNLDEQTLASATIEKKVQMLQSEFTTDNRDWIVRLSCSISKFCMCHPVIDREERSVHILGEKNNVATAIYFIEQMISKICVALEISKGWKSMNKKSEAVYDQNFFVGAVVGIIDKLKEQEKKIIAENKSMEVMVVDKRALAKRFTLDKFGGTLGQTRAGMHGNANSEAYGRGYSAGNNMDLNKGVAHGTGMKRRELE